MVEPGTQALIFQGGALAGAAPPGTYNLGRSIGGVDAAAPATAILVDAGDVTLMIGYVGIRTSEDVSVDAAFDIVVRLSDPMAVFANLMHGRESLGNDRLAELLSAQSANVIQARIKQVSVKDLYGNLELKNSLEADLRGSVSQALHRNGLELVEIRLVEFSGDEYRKVRDAHAKAFVNKELVDEAEKRSALNKRIREMLTAERMERLASAGDFEEFERQVEHDLGMKGLIRAAEMEDLKRTYEEKKGDSQTARRHLLEKLQLEHDLVLERVRRAGEAQKLDHDVEQQRKALSSRQEGEWEQAVHAKRVADLRREQEEADAEGAHRRKLKETQDWLGVRRTKIGVDDEEERLRIEQERKLAEIEQDIADRQAQREREQIKALSEVEQARLAADLRKTEVLKGMSEEQILALMAKDSPHVAAAIAERAKAQAQAGSSAEVKALYEKILAGKESEADRLERLAGKALEAMQRAAGAAALREEGHKREITDTAREAMDRMSDVAAARAGAADASRGQAPDVVCPRCKRQVPAGAKFCDNCGHKFFDNA